MPATRSIQVGGRPVAGGKVPLVCTPLVGETREAVLGEAAAVAARGPDLIEWRVDFYEGIGRTDEVVDLARSIKNLAGETPIIFTPRSVHEGGEPMPISARQVVDLHSAVCEARCCDFIDHELSNPPEDLRLLRKLSRDNGLGMIASHHDFEQTPPLDALFRKFLDAESSGADVAKVAVMPKSLEDVLTLLAATLKASRELGIPLISMSMGAFGSLSRLFGWVFGSAVTFAVGKAPSAPGQVPIEDLRAVTEILRRSLGDDQP